MPEGAATIVGFTALQMRMEWLGLNASSNFAGSSFVLVLPSGGYTFWLVNFAFELSVCLLRCSIKSTSATQTFFCAEDDKASIAGIKEQDRKDPSQNLDRYILCMFSLVP